MIDTKSPQFFLISVTNYPDIHFKQKKDGNLSSAIYLSKYIKLFWLDQYAAVHS